MGFLSDLFFDFLASLLGEAFTGRTRGRESAVFACELRVIAGRHEGLKDGWHEGEAFVRPGGLEFEVWARAGGGLRQFAHLRRNAPVSLPVRAVVTERQHPQDRSWGVVHGATVVELITDSATLEWAVPADKLEWALERVQSSEIPSA